MAQLKANTYLGPYYLARQIAVGGMAEIYLAQTKDRNGYDKQLALKVIQPDLAEDKNFVQMLVDEARITVGLNHPNIVQTFDLGKIEKCYFISMEYVDGPDFFKFLTGLSQMKLEMPLEVALGVLRQALQGLEYAHSKCDDQGQPLEIIHRDISPQNILLTPKGEVKLVDFGIAKAANLTHKTRAGVIKGKLIYMSPEQAWSDTVDQRTDIFSAGIVLYEALTGGSLYKELNPVKLLEEVRKANIRPPSSRRTGIPGELDSLVMKALTMRPSNSYQSAREFGFAIESYLKRKHPQFTNQDIGVLVQKVLEFEVQRQAPVKRTTGSMQREAYAVPSHSVILSQQELMGSSEYPVSARAGHGKVKSFLQLLGMDRDPFELGVEFLIGRAGEMGLGDARVSRQHARVILHEGDYFVEDLNSSNGTFLNEVQIQQMELLHPGDIIRVGPFKVRYFLDESYGEPLDSEHSDPGAEISESQIIPVESDEVSSQDKPGTAPLPAAPSARSTPRRDRKKTPMAELPDEGSKASMVFALEPENLTLEVGQRFPLQYQVKVGEFEVMTEGAVVIHKSSGYWLEPAENEPGVLHNDKKVSTPLLLQQGDTIQVGPFTLVFSVKI